MLYTESTGNPPPRRTHSAPLIPVEEPASGFSHVWQPVAISPSSGAESQIVVLKAQCMYNAHHEIHYDNGYDNVNNVIECGGLFGGMCDVFSEVCSSSVVGSSRASPGG